MLIDLGETTALRDPDPDRERPVRATRRPVVGVLLVLVLLAVGAAAPTGPAAGAIRPAGEVPIRVGASFSVTRDLLLVSEPDGTAATLTAYGLPAGRPRWRVPAAGVASFTAERAGDLVLITDLGPLGQRRGTVARAVDSGAVRWSSPRQVLASVDPTIGFAVTRVRSVAGPGRRVEGPVSAVDLATGTQRWSTEVAGTAVVTPMVVAGGAAVLVLSDTGQARLLDAGTGRLVRSVRLPPTDFAPDNPMVAGDQLVLRHLAGGRSTVSAYELPGLRRSWSAPTDGIGAIRACGRLACMLGDGEIRAVEPATGAIRWQVAATGWRTVSRSGDREIAVHPDVAQRHLLVALLDDLGGRVVGVVPGDVTDCRARHPLLVCRTATDRLGVWRFA